MILRFMNNFSMINSWVDSQNTRKHPVEHVRLAVCTVYRMDGLYFL